MDDYLNTVPLYHDTKTYITKHFHMACSLFGRKWIQINGKKQEVKFSDLTVVSLTKKEEKSYVWQWLCLDE